MLCLAHLWTPTCGAAVLAAYSEPPCKGQEAWLSSRSSRLPLVSIQLRLPPSSRGQRGMTRFSKSANGPRTEGWAATASFSEICCLQQCSRPKVRRTPGQPGSLPRKPVTCCSLWSETRGSSEPQKTPGGAGEGKGWCTSSARLWLCLLGVEV